VLANDAGVIVGTLRPRTGLAERFALLGGALLACLAVGFVAYRSFLYITIFRSSATNSRDIPIVLLSRRGKILLANPAFCERLSIPPNGAVGKRWPRVLGEDYHRPLREVLARIPSDPVPRVEKVSLATPAFNGTFLLRIYPARSLGAHIGTFITMHDITRVLRSDQLVNWASIAHSMAHEMKTPLSTIWFTLARIRQELAAGAPGHVEAHLASIEEEVRRVDNYIKGFMKLANINPPNVQRTDLNAAVREVLDTYRTKLPESTLVETDLSEELPAIDLDVHLFTVAMRNLLDNAISAMKGKGILKVSTYLVRNLNASIVYFSLSDTGSGIAPEDVPKVFEPYFSKADGGTGLGLVITKKIIEDHGGSIALTSQRGLGTEVVIQLPVSRGAGGADHDS
jgi:two-component system nitrogen regulation sensor histidine kinase NtrY